MQLRHSLRMARLPEVQIIQQQSSRDKMIAWVNGNVSETFLFSRYLNKEEFSSAHQTELWQCFCRLFCLREKKKKTQTKTQTSKNLKIFAFIIWNPVYWALGKSYGKPELFTSHSLVMGQDRKLMFQLWLGSTLLCFIIITLVWEWNYWWSGAWVPCQHKTSTNKDLVAKIHTSQHTILSFTSDKTYPVFWLAIK